MSLPNVNLIWFLLRPGIDVDFGLLSISLVIIDSQTQRHRKDGSPPGRDVCSRWVAAWLRISMLVA